MAFNGSSIATLKSVLSGIPGRYPKLNTFLPVCFLKKPVQYVYQNSIDGGAESDHEDKKVTTE